MNIVEFFFGIFKECFNILNVDVFNLGFTWLEFLLAGGLILIIVKFLFNVVGVADGIDVSSIFFGFSRQRQISNAKREKDVSYVVLNRSLDTGHGRSTQVSKLYKDGELRGVINEYTDF